MEFVANSSSTSQLLEEQTRVENYEHSKECFSNGTSTANNFKIIDDSQFFQTNNEMSGSFSVISKRHHCQDYTKSKVYKSRIITELNQMNTKNEFYATENYISEQNTKSYQSNYNNSRLNKSKMHSSVSFSDSNVNSGYGSSEISRYSVPFGSSVYFSTCLHHLSSKQYNFNTCCQHLTSACAFEGRLTVCLMRSSSFPNSELLIFFLHVSFNSKM